MIRAENGEIRKRLDTIEVDRALQNSDQFNLFQAVCNMELGFFRRENPADKIPLLEQWVTMQRTQTTLRGHRSGLAYLRALLEKAKTEMASDGYISERTRGAILCEFGFWDYLFALQCMHAGPPAATPENGPSGVVDDKEAEKKRAAVVALIDHQLERINTFKDYALEREEVTGDAEARAFSLPPADATDKLLRYEAHLDRQLYRAMDQLERLQRRRKGENVLPPFTINLGRRS